MRLWTIALLAAALPVPAAAQTTADWCPVAAADGKAALPALVRDLQPKLDSQPSPLAHVHTEGTLPHHGIRDESIAAELNDAERAAFTETLGNVLGHHGKLLRPDDVETLG